MKNLRLKVVAISVGMATIFNAGCTNESKAETFAPFETTSRTTTTTGTVPGAKIAPRKNAELLAYPFNNAQVISGIDINLSQGLDANEIIDKLSQHSDTWIGTIDDNTPFIKTGETLTSHGSAQNLPDGLKDDITTVSKDGKQLGSAEKFTKDGSKKDDIIFAVYYKDHNPRVTDFTAEFVNAPGFSSLFVDVDPEANVFLINSDGKLELPSSNTVELRRTKNGFNHERDTLEISMANRDVSNYIQGVVVHRPQTNVTSIIAVNDIGVTI